MNTTKMNAAMQRLFLRRSIRKLRGQDISAIKTEVSNFISKLEVYSDGDAKWIAPRDMKTAYKSIKEEFEALSDYEHYYNELYLGKSVLKRPYREMLQTILDCIESEISCRFPNQCFYISMCGQMKRFSSLDNIVVWIYLYRGNEFYTDTNNDIESFSQPVLYRMIKT